MILVNNIFQCNQSVFVMIIWNRKLPSHIKEATTNGFLYCKSTSTFCFVSPIVVVAAVDLYLLCWLKIVEYMSLAPYSKRSVNLDNVSQV